jgi:aryl-alcohol dehydrogenase-like predicted oxidoreductase
VGARNSIQAIENARAVDIQLSKDELAFISKELSTMK